MLRCAYRIADENKRQFKSAIRTDLEDVVAEQSRSADLGWLPRPGG